jgi:hypothetical protein
VVPGESLTGSWQRIRRALNSCGGGQRKSKYRIWQQVLPFDIRFSAQSSKPKNIERGSGLPKPQFQIQATGNHAHRPSSYYCKQYVFVCQAEPRVSECYFGKNRKKNFKMFSLSSDCSASPYKELTYTGNFSKPHVGAFFCSAKTGLSGGCVPPLCGVTAPLQKQIRNASRRDLRPLAHEPPRPPPGRRGSRHTVLRMQNCKY